MTTTGSKKDQYGRRWKNLKIAYCQTAFTLIELLVTASIIGILAMFALPAFNASRARGKSLQCQSNLRQIGVAMASYLGDNNQEYPHAYNATTGATTWMQKLAPYAGIPENQMGPAPLKRAMGIFLCPEYRPSGREVAYALNYSIDPTQIYKSWNYRPLSVSGANLFLIIEVAMNSDLYSPNRDGEVARRHPFSSANYLFVDGHVENIKDQVPSTDPRWAP